MKPALLHVVGVYSNPRRYASRSRLLREWIERTLDSGVSVTLVEHAFGKRAYELDPGDPLAQHVTLVQVRGGPEHELWLKEGLVNLGVSRLPETARYVCWEDTDITHVNHDWAIETIHMLQHHRVGQTWEHSMDLGPRGECVRNEWGNDVDRSFSAAWLAGDICPEAATGVAPLTAADFGGYGACVADIKAPALPLQPTAQRQSRTLLENQGEIDWRRHFGYSWAIRSDALKGIGRMIDWLVTGSADYHMAMCFAGYLTNLDARMSPGYNRRLREFAQRCEDHVRQDIGCVPGSVLHHWHGSKRNRFYLSRFDILIESGFDPDVDLAYDVHGLPTLVSDNRLLRDGLRRYNSRRNEDSVDL